MLDFSTLKPGDQIRDAEMAFIVVGVEGDELTMRNGPQRWYVKQADAVGYEVVPVSQIPMGQRVTVIRRSVLRHSYTLFGQTGIVISYQAPYYAVQFDNGKTGDFLFAELSGGEIHRGDQLMIDGAVCVVTRSPAEEGEWFSQKTMVWRNGAEEEINPARAFSVITRSISPLGSIIKITGQSLPKRASMFKGREGMVVEIVPMTSGVYYLTQFAPGEVSAYLEFEFERISLPAAISPDKILDFIHDFR